MLHVQAALDKKRSRAVGQAPGPLVPLSPAATSPHAASLASPAAAAAGGVSLTPMKLQHHQHQQQQHYLKQQQQQQGAHTPMDLPGQEEDNAATGAECYIVATPTSAKTAAHGTAAKGGSSSSSSTPTKQQKQQGGSNANNSSNYSSSAFKVSRWKPSLPWSSSPSKASGVVAPQNSNTGATHVHQLAAAYEKRAAAQAAAAECAAADAAQKVLHSPTHASRAHKSHKSAQQQQQQQQQEPTAVEEADTFNSSSNSSSRAGSPLKPKPPVAGSSPQRSRPSMVMRQQSSSVVLAQHGTAQHTAAQQQQQQQQQEGSEAAAATAAPGAASNSSNNNRGPGGLVAAIIKAGAAVGNNAGTGAAAGATASTGSGGVQLRTQPKQTNKQGQQTAQQQVQQQRQSAQQQQQQQRVGSPSPQAPARAPAGHHTSPQQQQQQCVPIAVAGHCPEDLKGYHWQPKDFIQTKKLYEGKIAAVVQGYHASSRRPLALKIYNRARLDTMERFQLAREVCLHMRASHPAITSLYAAYKDSRFIYLLMELAPSGNLYQMLMSLPVLPGHPRCLPESDAVVRVIQPLLSALAYLHEQGIIHRDIKLENVLLASDGTIKLADFGLSIDTRHEPANTRLGTQGYFAPEVLGLPLKSSPFEGKSPEEAAARPSYDCKVDVWSAGVVCFEVLTGRAPFAAENVAQVLQAILHRQLVYPGHLSQLAVSFLSTALTRDPKTRPTVQQLLEHPFITQHTAAGAGAGAAAGTGAGA